MYRNIVRRICMIIIMKPGTTRLEAEEILNQIESAGLKPLYMPGTERTVLGAIGDERKLAGLHIENHPSVDRITPVLTPYKLVSRECHPADTLVNLGGVLVGGKRFAIIAGPCAVESPEQMFLTARAIKDMGAHCLRGGAYKPRSSPYSFQGLGEEGLKILHDVSKKIGLPAVTEVIETEDVSLVEHYADAFQVGARNMQNFRLLKALGRSRKPVILKRGMSATVEDLLLAAEYVVSEGNPHVILCERGIRTFETATRNTLDLNAIPFLKQHSHLPVIVDPSHGTGVREYVGPMSKAAAACGADGLLVEVHHNPKAALSDGHQSLDPAQFSRFMDELRPFVEAAGREL
jgi:3-deoxy-7-phosphoheptulonate synthase